MKTSSIDTLEASLLAEYLMEVLRKYEKEALPSDKLIVTKRSEEGWYSFSVVAYKETNENQTG